VRRSPNTVRKAELARARRKSEPPAVAFDRAYYERYYLDPDTRVDDAAHHASLACGIVSLVEYFGQELRSVLDVGAGIGRWGAWLRKHRPSVSVLSTEMDPAVCARYGHERRDIARWRARRRFDLVICQGVLPYLDDDAASRAIENLAAMCGGFLYLEAITAHDLDEVCDLERTDARVHRRTGAWYATRLRPHFRAIGAGLHYARRGPLTFYELEAEPESRATEARR
jgi:hypothetical protein